MATNFHSIKANLHENSLTEDPNDFVGRVVSENTLDVGNVCESAVSRGGADVSAASMQHSVNLFFKEMAYLLCDGFSVNTGYFSVGAHLNGVFNSPTENFTPGKHTLSFLFQQGEALRKELSNVDVKILGVAENGTNIAQVTDVRTGSVNDTITPGRNLKIKGSKIKVSGENAGVGIYFINQGNNERTKVETEDIVTNNPSEVIIVTPALAAGTYQLEITTQFSGANLLKEPRTTVFDRILTVQ